MISYCFTIFLFLFYSVHTSVIVCIYIFLWCFIRVGLILLKMVKRKIKKNKKKIGVSLWKENNIYWLALGIAITMICVCLLSHG